jgi:hypothetical protein
LSTEIPIDAVDRYEALRPEGYSLPIVSGMGWVLLVRCGMVAWLRAWPTYVSTPTAKPSSTESDERPVLPQGLRDAVIPVLADMVLTYHQEV